MKYTLNIINYLGNIELYYQEDTAPAYVVSDSLKYNMANSRSAYTLFIITFKGKKLLITSSVFFFIF